jgi:hypothetical protein
MKMYITFSKYADCYNVPPCIPPTQSTRIYVFRMPLRMNSDYFPKQHSRLVFVTKTQVSDQRISDKQYAQPEILT